ncbi:oligopeptide transporter, putative [Candida dubliniensis CD36]|uniref:Oligopeptide transporter, putative n=1 Tax=Candida dubliniensis (strain CD36 / ATCC MYA-646 / CBS 7987 / NCPF 3949 / NRRL Y-17841) TaxID=573826 RepID=B9WL92_CANDC|nr:oligopeptide transporter, putative [Candida dubliniensis CD36]CAX39797.1 oligopeptide transporter, putative [Candida dubliniensis CD36]
MTQEPIIPVISQIKTIQSHLQTQDHEINLDIITSQQFSLGDIATSLTNDQKWFVLKRLHFDTLVSFKNLPTSAIFILEKLENLSIEEAIELLKSAILEHNNDVNIPENDLILWRKLIEWNDKIAEKNSIDSNNNTSSSNNEKDLINSKIDINSIEKGNGNNTANGNFSYHQIVDWELQIRLEAVLVAYWSPYPEVRAVTFPFDDPKIPVETFRVYLIGFIWTAIGAVINQFFAERRPAISLSMAVVQVFLYPSGILCQWILPNWEFQIWKLTINLNPGPYTYKEQMLATIFCGVTGGGTSYAAWNILMQKSSLFYNNQWVDFGYQVLLILCTNFMGIGLAGIMRKFAVYPTKAVWPSVLPNLALNKTLLTPGKKEIINGWTIPSYNFFFITFIISFIYFWIPDYLFQALSTFNWMTWIKPDNLNLAVITGSVGGLGLNPITTFDWNYLSALLQPLQVPFFNTASNLVGMFIAFFCIIGVWYSNYKWTGYLPINDNGLFTNTGQRYSVSSVVNKNSLFDNAKYQEIGPPFYTAGNLVVYGAFFALYPFHIVYEIGMNYEQMWDACTSFWRVIKNYKKSTYDGFNDPHCTMMKAYPEVPEWAYLIIVVIALVLAILCVKLYPAETPVWGIFFALGTNVVFLIPLTTIYARTGFSFGLNVLVELIVGYAIPGNGLALAFIKALGYNIDGQAQNFVNDLKQGHYAKLPPRAVYRAQILSVFIASFIQLGILNFQINGGIKDYCDPKNTQKFTCPNARTFYSASVLWGVIGPKRVFNGLYPILRWCFLIGFLIAFPCIIIKRWGPRKYVKYFEPSIIIGGFLNYAPYNLSYYIPGFYVSFVFMSYIKKNYEAWWQKYNYILSTGLNAGIAFSSIIIFFAVMYHAKDINWWGNNVMYEGMDYLMSGWLNATIDAPDGYFGPRVGHFP